ncbi:16S rRNA m(2)G966-methyltransferase [Salmonella enterica subsp. enterica]|uniref:Ribosomal RNA small subunit methyltransferase D n=141 Tax=Salmonella TaxID=590 RepID=A0A379WJE3_SALET|nr:16S rRNA m(2)G966-methyltransferase [Salmonella enterica subsp. enterica]
MKKPTHSGSGQIRIIGGQWRGRKLPVPDSPGLRPTTDRVRETLFNWLGSGNGRRPLSGLLCRQRRAGPGGAIALCGQATLLEMDRAVSQQLQKNLATLKANNARVVNTNTLAFLSQPGTPHHVVFVDPPFRKGLLEETLQLLETQGWLADDALIYVESEVEKRSAARSGELGIVSRKRWPDRSLIVCISATRKEKMMLINLGRLLMLFVWAFLILNLVHPFPRPLNIFVNVALVFMALMHGMQLALLKSTIPKEGPQMTTGEKIRIFLFGVFELLVWQKKFKNKK